MHTRRQFSECLRILALAVLVASGCSSIRSARGNTVAIMRPIIANPLGAYQVGLASWYGEQFAGRPTANGEIFDPEGLTAAHRTLPLGTRVRVTNLENRRQVVVRINDRGPYIRGRIIDLSRGSARRLGYLNQGLTKVRIDIVDRPAG